MVNIIDNEGLNRENASPGIELQKMFSSTILLIVKTVLNIDICIFLHEWKNNINGNCIPTY